MPSNIIITDSGFSNNEPETEIFTRAGCQLTVLQCTNEAELLSNVQNADALLVQWAPVTKKVIESLTHCKVIVRYGIGVDNVDIIAAKDHGIPVCNVPDYCIDEVADHTIALVLTSLRQIKEVGARINAGDWKITPPRSVQAFSNLDFHLAGFGRIAQEVAARAKALRFRVSAYDPFVAPELMLAAGVTPLTADNLLEGADVLSLHLPLNEKTHHFINHNTISRMKPGVLIVNTSRGGLINADALAHALQTGRIWGAALDVFELEPLPAGNVLMQAPNLILTSHTAWYSAKSVPELQRKAAEEVVRGLQGKQILHRVN
jgi:D-3-phosphoglycerate dehydrogenase